VPADLRFVAAELRTRLASLDAELHHDEQQAVMVSDATHDSREVGRHSGMLFCCVRGQVSDGHDFAAAAVANGAVALLVERRLSLAVPQLVVRNAREAMGHVAAIVHNDPARSLRLVGITGTNGKTTTAHLLGHVLTTSGRRTEVLGTLTQSRTTPEATDLHRRLAGFRDDGVQDVVMEVTSHALELNRVAGCHFALAIFTNLSQDHLDFHGTMESYFRAKAKLFVPEFTDSAIVNLDDRYGSLLRDSAIVPTEGVGLSDVTDLVLEPGGSSFVWRSVAVRTAMAGEFNVRNAIMVATAARQLGVSDEAVQRGLSEATVPGRYEPVSVGQDFAVIVDYAHTPDGLLRVLQAARTSIEKRHRVIVVFGCGGDRDRAKRPLMGEIGATHADLVYVTSDNPRSEDPGVIIDDIVAGVSRRDRLVIVRDRREAILAAIASARSGDVVVLAGKGHETGQTVGDMVTPFDDRVVAVEALRERERLSS
jgi:UDP-N-acetylmuramoyl-L-alanyl-D-glutamate--2,6-diaminopimelate ligase